jgi:hypothetical protein
MTESPKAEFLFEAHCCRRVVARFEGAGMTTEGGELLLHEGDRKISLLRLARSSMFFTPTVVSLVRVGYAVSQVRAISNNPLFCGARQTCAGEMRIPHFWLEFLIQGPACTTQLELTPQHAEASRSRRWAGEPFSCVTHVRATVCASLVILKTA